ARDAGSHAGWVGLGSLLMRQRRFGEALEAWGRALDLEPEVPTVLFQVARAQHRLGRLQEAADTYLEVAILDGAHAKALAARGELARRFLRDQAASGHGRDRAYAIAERLAGAPRPTAASRSVVTALAETFSADAVG